MTILGFRGVHPLMLLFFPVALGAVLCGFWLLRRYRGRLSGRLHDAYLALFAALSLAVAAGVPIMRANAKYSLIFYMSVLAVFAALNLALAMAVLYGQAGQTGPAGQACPAGLLAFSRRRFLTGGVIAAAGTLASMAGVDAATGSEGAVVERRIELLRSPEATPGRELRLSLVSDLHAGFFLPGANLNAAARLISAFRPDAILFGGDLVEYGLGALDEAKGFFRELSALAPVYAVLGNHDCYVDPDAVAAFHRLQGVRPLRGESEVLAGPWGRFTLCGLRDMIEQDASFDCLRGQELASTILLAHNPQMGLMAPEEQVPWLTLSGHTHGGQLCLPVVGPMVNQADRRLLAGLNEIGDRRIAVTAGLGWSGLPVRFLCPPDVTNIVVA